MPTPLAETIAATSVNPRDPRGAAHELFASIAQVCDVLMGHMTPADARCFLECLLNVQTGHLARRLGVESTHALLSATLREFEHLTPLLEALRPGAAPTTLQ